MTDITNIVAAIVMLLVAAATTFLIPLLKKKMDASKFEELKKWAEVGVQAAEMIYKGTGLGAQKKEYVLEFLEERGYSIDTEVINAVIEAAVLDMKNAAK